MINHYLTSSEATEFVAQQINQPVTYHDLDNLIRAKAIQPPILLAGRRLWSPKDLKAVCKAIRIRRAKRPEYAEKRIATMSKSREI